MSEMKSPLARLVLFLVALSLFGGLVAGIASSVPARSPQNPAPANVGADFCWDDNYCVSDVRYAIASGKLTVAPCVIDCISRVARSGSQTLDGGTACVLACNKK